MKSKIYIDHVTELGLEHTTELEFLTFILYVKFCEFVYFLYYVYFMVQKQ